MCQDVQRIQGILQMRRTLGVPHMAFGRFQLGQGRHDEGVWAKEGRRGRGLGHRHGDGSVGRPSEVWQSPSWYTVHNLHFTAD